jgi:hypothetical protein
MTIQQVALGHKLNMFIDFLDQNGNPMLTPVVPDAVPTWTTSSDTVATEVIAADGLSAVMNPIAVGTDQIGISVLVKGVKYEATLDVNVTGPAEQVLTTVSIRSVVE